MVASPLALQWSFLPEKGLKTNCKFQCNTMQMICDQSPAACLHAQCNHQVFYDPQDRTEQKIVCSESADLLKLFAGLRSPASANPCPDYYPEAKRAEIDSISKLVVTGLGMQVYKCVFAKSQASRACHL